MEWNKEMTLLQNSDLRKTFGAVKGSSGDKINAIAAVESVEVFAEAATGRFLAVTDFSHPVTKHRSRQA